MPSAARVAILLLVCSACVMPRAGRGPAPAAAPASAGWYCFADDAGSLCARTLEACVASERDVGFIEGACRPAPAAYCTRYQDLHGSTYEVCMTSRAECAELATYLRTPDPWGGARVVDGSVAACVSTP